MEGLHDDVLLFILSLRHFRPEELFPMKMVSSSWSNIINPLVQKWRRLTRLPSLYRIIRDSAMINPFDPIDLFCEYIEMQKRFIYTFPGIGKGTPRQALKSVIRPPGSNFFANNGHTHWRNVLECITSQAGHTDLVAVHPSFNGEGFILNQWKCMIMGSPDSRYAGCIFRATITYGEGCPFSPPTVHFDQDMFHPNIIPSSGQPVLDILMGDWVVGMWPPSTVTLALASILEDEQDTCPDINPEAFIMYKTDRQKYIARTARLARENSELTMEDIHRWMQYTPK